MSKTSNILDEIHDTLDPLVWDNPADPEPTLKHQHHEWITRTILDVLQNHYERPEEWLSLVFTGSLTTYQYSDDSDVDISLFVDVQTFPEWNRAEMIKVMIHEVDGTKMPGTPHVIQAFVIPEGVSKESLYQRGLRSGYDMDTDGWIVPPERERIHDVEQEYHRAYVYSLMVADKMERLLDYEPQAAVEFWHRIHKRRQHDQQKGKGDFADSNIAYKMLVKRGLLSRISDASGEYIAKVAKALRVEVQTQNRTYPQADNRRAFWLDEANGVIYLSGVGGIHADLLNEFGLAFGGMVQGVVSQIDSTPKLSFQGMDKFISPEERQAVINALEPYVPGLAVQPELEPAWAF